jgi:predicted component of type VI protein secretion system
MSDATTIRMLQELIEALDRRLPHVERAGEAAIAEDAAALKQRALERIAELERKRASAHLQPHSNV